ncbi:MAG: alanine--tRNA ligase [Ginsengibacter sp.]
MLSSAEIRQQFLDFFKAKNHTIVPSSPIVIKDDPTLLFTNAGMNQFKDYFLGNKIPPYTRVADTQKCLRVSGKHNDLEEVGVDTYHHTMFEMLGNWSFGDYFKKEAIAWSWKLLTEVYKINKDQLYVTVFEGDEKESLPKDEESISFWKVCLSDSGFGEAEIEDRIIMGNKKDNFWEMGDTGPCGPCTEIHVDTRPEEERRKVEGKTLVNKDDPQVIEIWNNVFIQYNRKKDGSLEPLPAKHVDTGMGFERLVRVIQKKESNYDTDVFTATIAEIEELSNKKYTNTDSKGDIAFRVIADHIRAIAFPIADGQLPSNTGAGYVIRRVLRRAVRYYFSYLNVKQPLLHKLIPLLSEQFKNVFPELEKQKDFVAKVINEEEQNFLRTLEKGLNILKTLARSRISLFNKDLITNTFNSHDSKLINQFKQFLGEDYGTIPINKNVKARDFILKIYKDEKYLRNLDHYAFGAKHHLTLHGWQIFELYDTFGFPLDLIKLAAADYGIIIDDERFDTYMQEQKKRSRAASVVETEDWININENGSSKFVGYDLCQTESNVLKYRRSKSQGKESYQIVLDKTPFYAESGGQVGDTGSLFFDGEEIEVTDTKKENDLIIHFAQKLPADISSKVVAKIDERKRASTQVHHTATHVMHAALRQVLGKHVAQKGSLVNDEHLRFDFSHFAKVTDEELAKVESIVNEKIRKNIPVIIKEMKKDEAIAMGAMALFGEKYGETVRVVIIDPEYSIELCGGTHVGNTGELGIFKIKHETAIGAGVRRIEAVSGKGAEDFINNELDIIRLTRETLKNPKDVCKAVENLMMENAELRKQVEKFETNYLSSLKNDLLQKVEKINEINFIGQIVSVTNADALRKISFSLKNDLENFIVVLAADIQGKPHVALMIHDKIVSEKNLDATKIIKEHIAPLIKGGGGGQKTFATAGGSVSSNLTDVMECVKQLL